MVILREIILSEGGRRVDYRYEATGVARRFLAGRPAFFVIYDQDVSACPQSILAIPFVANVEPIGWAAGFDVQVPELDKAFAASRPAARQLFAKMYPGKFRQAGVKATRLVSNDFSGSRALMLFSGGLDAAVTLLRHASEALSLVTVRGADIELADESQWDLCLRHIRSEPTFSAYPHATVIANLREFYSQEVDARLLFGWWGHVQHGHGLLGLLAPLSHVQGAGTCYIAGGSFMEAWGSTGAGDQLLAWAGVRCVHDAERMTRQEKAEIIVQHARRLGRKISLRICYSGLRVDGNCGRCEKCYRTALNFILAGADPRDFGIPFDETTYDRIFATVTKIKASKGIVPCWQEIAEAARKALAAGNHFVFRDPVVERRSIERLASGEIDAALARNFSHWHDEWTRLKFVLRVRYPRLYAFLRWLKTKLR